MHPEIASRQEKLETLFDHAKDMQDNDDIDLEIRIQFVWYLCVRTSGYVEYSVRTILSEYFESGTGSQPLRDFVSNDLLQPREISMRRVRRLLRSFKNSQSKIESELDFSELETSLVSIQTNRNSIAHGRNSELTMNDLDKYFEDAKTVIRMVYEECNPRNGEGLDM